jgi:hypothetical protein
MGGLSLQFLAIRINRLAQSVSKTLQNRCHLVSRETGQSDLGRFTWYDNGCVNQAIRELHGQCDHRGLTRRRILLGLVTALQVSVLASV